MSQNFSIVGGYLHLKRECFNESERMLKEFMVKMKAIRRVIILNQDGVQVKKMIGTGQLLLCIAVLL